MGRFVKFVRTGRFGGDFIRESVGPDRFRKVVGRTRAVYGPKDERGADTYVLCEIDVSSVFAIPDQAAAEIARCVARRLGRGM